MSLNKGVNMKNSRTFQMFFSGAIMAATLVGCGKSTHTQVADSVKDNKEAHSLVEWENSKAHPEVLFANWREEAAQDAEKAATLPKEVCDTLTALEGQELTIFEEEINNEENQSLVETCKPALKEILDIYYADQRSRLAVAVNASVRVGSKNQFKFPDNVQYRDMSNGYFGVSGDVKPKEIVLTFDDGPNGVYTPSILRTLKEVNAKAVFFALGKAVRANPEALKMVAADGHTVGSHSIDHKCLGTRSNCKSSNGGRVMTFEEASDEIRGGHQAFYDTLGLVDHFCRFPFGESSPEFKRFLKDKQTGEFYWSIDSNDWKAQSNEDMMKSTLEQIERRGRGIVLFHDIQRKTAETLPAFLRELYSRGYSVVLLKSSDANARYNSKLVRKKLP
jgi:peptidoglycan/xylan/chitin deacetylase (PgdA/CDA1 family)